MDYYIYRAKQYIGDVPNYIFLRPYVFLFFGPEGIILFIVTGQGLILEGKQKIHILDLWRTQFVPKEDTWIVLAKKKKASWFSQTTDSNLNRTIRQVFYSVT